MRTRWRERRRKRGRECLGMDNAVSESLLTSAGSFPVALSSGLGLSDWRRVNDNQVISIMPEKLPALAKALAPRGYKSGAKLRLSRLRDTDTNTHARIYKHTHRHKQTHTLRYRYITHTPHAAHKSKSNCELVAIKQQQQSQSEAAARQSSCLPSPASSLAPLSLFLSLLALLLTIYWGGRFIVLPFTWHCF